MYPFLCSLVLLVFGWSEFPTHHRRPHPNFRFWRVMAYSNSSCLTSPYRFPLPVRIRCGTWHIIHTTHEITQIPLDLGLPQANHYPRTLFPRSPALLPFAPPEASVALHAYNARSIPWLVSQKEPRRCIPIVSECSGGWVGVGFHVFAFDLRCFHRVLFMLCRPTMMSYFFVAPSHRILSYHTVAACDRHETVVPPKLTRSLQYIDRLEPGASKYTQHVLRHRQRCVPSFTPNVVHRITHGRTAAGISTSSFLSAGNDCDICTPVLQ